MRRSIESSLLVPAAILFGSLIISGAIMTSIKDLGRSQAAALAAARTQYPAQEAQPATKPAAKNVNVDASKIVAAGSPYIGSSTAPVTIFYWYDYQCPFCKHNEETILPRLISEYVNTGMVRIIFKNYQFLGKDSIALGKMSRAVWDLAPGRFYSWHKAIFDAQGAENSGWASADLIRSITARTLGTTTADKALALATKNSSVYEKRMAADKAEGVSLGVSGTPASIIGTILLIGARPYPDYAASIEEALRNVSTRPVPLK